MSPYSLETLENDCYPETSVLINKFDIRNQDELNDIEKMFVLTRSAEIESTKINVPFSFDSYCQIHKYLFGDIYNWAGKPRTINLSKRGTAFYPYESIKELGDAKFAYLQSKNEFVDLPHKEYIKEISDFYNELNLLHPFREGNGRTQRLFFRMLIRRAGYEIDFQQCDTNKLITATIQAAHGVVMHLEDFFDESINFHI